LSFLKKKEKASYIATIESNLQKAAEFDRGTVDLATYIQQSHQISTQVAIGRRSSSSSSPITKLAFWDLLWSEGQIGNKLWTNAFGGSCETDQSKVFLLYVTTSNEVPRDRKVDENNSHVLIVPGRKLSSILLPYYLGIIGNVSEENVWKFTRQELEIPNLLKKTREKDTVEGEREKKRK